MFFNPTYTTQTTCTIDPIVGQRCTTYEVPTQSVRYVRNPYTRRVSAGCRPFHPHRTPSSYDYFSGRRVVQKPMNPISALALSLLTAFFVFLLVLN